MQVKKKKKLNVVIGQVPGTTPFSSTKVDQNTKEESLVEESKPSISKPIIPKGTNKKSFDDWNKDHFRIFVGNLGPEVSDSMLLASFSEYKSISKAAVVFCKKSHKSKGYGFVAFSEGRDFLDALKEVNNKYIGSRPVKLRKSTWKDK